MFSGEGPDDDDTCPGAVNIAATTTTLLDLTTTKLIGWSWRRPTDDDSHLFKYLFITWVTCDIFRFKKIYIEININEKRWMTKRVLLLLFNI